MLIRLPVPLALFQARSAATFFSSWARRDRPAGYDVLLISRPHVFVVAAEWAETQFPGAYVVYDADAVSSQREFAYARARNATAKSKLWTYAAEVRAAEASVVLVRWAGGSSCHRQTHSPLHAAVFGCRHRRIPH